MGIELLIALLLSFFIFVSTIPLWLYIRPLKQFYRVPLSSNFQLIAIAWQLYLMQREITSSSSTTNSPYQINEDQSYAQFSISR